jgi:hypothetical protein
VTDFFEPFASGGLEHAMAVERQQGISLTNAALGTPTFWSILPNGSKISNGK